MSNSLLKSSFSRTNAPSVAAARPISLSKRLLLERTVTPDDKNTTSNATSVRQKRELTESTTLTPTEDTTKTTESPNITQSIVNELNESVERNETFDQNTESPSNDSYPSFHVTYWMFYPYSQVGKF